MAFTLDCIVYVSEPVHLCVCVYLSVSVSVFVCVLVSVMHV
jgi:hypothetical protein